MADANEEKIKREMDEVLHGHSKAAQGPAGFKQNEYTKIHHVIGVISGKGGVGKSFVCGSLAVELARSGARVGILDADITGPSIPKMLGLAGERATAVNDILVPATTKGGIEVMSANLVLENETDPIVWRGPVIAGALRQFFEECAWGELDYLLVDMPPGTGDVPLTVFQSLPIEGVVVVSSPQDLVQMVVGKAFNMASMMSVPVLGLVENMAYVTCPHCGEKIWPYGPSHLAQTADEYGIDALGELPIDPALAAACDHGTLEDELPQGFLPKAVDAIVSTCEFDDAKASGAAE
ncbi:Mrp/NBP35 family ATP-binding protein [Tractidigestivibacter scatoligenes]|jgi:Mrp family chromosome partitioning ATPase|nr:Mrp/NBP35 family ATP-binding protein [Tractidigestivibacter scatoligenes]